MMCLRLWATALASLVLQTPVAAQAIQDLVTTEDGSVLYFSSPVRPVGTDRSFHWKIYRWDAVGGIRVVAEVPDEEGFDGCTTTNFYQLHAPQVSADGTTFGYTGQRPPVGKFCDVRESSQGVIQSTGQGVKLDGNLAITANGRYAITMPLAAVTNGFHVVTDLKSVTSAVVSGAFNGPRQRVTDEATVATPEPAAVVLTDRNGFTRVLQTAGPVDDVIISRSGASLVHVSNARPVAGGGVIGASMTVIDVASGHEGLLAAAFTLSRPSLTSDGRTVLFISNEPRSLQLHVIGIDGTGGRQVTNETNGISDAVISGDGRVAYAVTQGSRLVRVDVASGSVTELMTGTAMITNVNGSVIPTYGIAPTVAIGSRVNLGGWGVMKKATFCGRPVPIVAPSTFQVPWDTSEGECQLIVQSDSPFEHGITLEVQEFLPRFGFPLHADFRPITADSPAQQDEVIVTYMTGLGPVDGSGQLAPGFGCSLGPSPADVLYAGLAPGVTGAYQVNVRLPSSTSINPYLYCGWSDRQIGAASTSIWFAP